MVNYTTNSNKTNNF